MPFLGIDPVLGSCYGAFTLRRPRYLATGALALGAAFAVWVDSGCGPIEYLSQVTGKATKAVAAAKQAGAETRAPYEYTAAEAYLVKAREEAGFAQYEQAIAYGRRAEELALRAQAKAATATANDDEEEGSGDDGAGAAGGGSRPGAKSDVVPGLDTSVPAEEDTPPAPADLPGGGDEPEQLKAAGSGRP